MKKNVVLLFVLFSTYCFSQSYIEGYIYDKEAKEPLPYATIKIISNNNFYTITNEDGKFEIRSNLPTDSLEVRFIGYKTMKISVSYFKQNLKFYLSPNAFQLNQVLVVAKKDKNYTYNLLYNLIKKYRNKLSITKSKVFFTLTSSAKGIPIEIIEGFYNSEQNLSKGIVDLKLKSGRFGQNQSFPFYSLKNTSFLKNFHFFKKENQLLPQYPGNLSLSTIKRKYKVKIDPCNNCSFQDLSISFSPKKPDGQLFFGKIIFNKETLTIKKIELSITDPKIIDLVSIIKNDVITPKSINLTINFNPMDYEKIQSINFEFTMYYESEENLNIITSNSLLYFYDYDKPFKEPYFTNNIHFNNDYDKIIALQTSDDFWNLNYQFPKSFKEKRVLNFLKKYGYLINYKSTIPSSYIKFIEPAVISWSKDNRLDWKIVNRNLINNEKQTNYTNYTKGVTIKTSKVSYSNSEIIKSNFHSKRFKNFKFSYILDTYKNKKGNVQFITRTIFDRNSSFFKGKQTKNKLIYINLIFDIYEYYRQDLTTEIFEYMNLTEVKERCDKKFEEATLIVKKMKKETESGLDIQNLIKWNNMVKSKLKIDNLLMIKIKN